MNVVEAMYKRQSIRAFKPDPVSKELLLKVMEAAIQAPSWANTQPWEFAIVGGTAMAALKEAIHNRAVEEVPGHPDIPNPSFPDPLQSRRRTNGIQLFAHLGIGREDRDRQREWTLKGLRFFDAPNGIIIYIEKCLNAWSIFDAGLVAQNIMLAAVEYGLGTCPQAAVVRQPDELRRVLGIPESKFIVVGIAIGYPDWDDVPNKFRSAREALENITNWCGF